MRQAGVLLAAASLIALTACHGKSSPTETKPVTAAPHVASADPDAMCAEHGILEAICTKCNPALIPVFQAKGDWCQEHGFPESACPICHPEKGGRPSADMSGATGPRNGTRITFKSKDSAELAGIEAVPALEGPVLSGLEVLGRVVPDGSRIARVNPRAPGVLREVLADVGTKVAPGTPLALIESSELGAAQSHVRAAEARVATARAEAEREKDLLAERISSDRDAQAAQRALEEAEADLAAARSEVGVVGAVTGPGRYRLTSPMAGVVTQRDASAGQVVHEDDTLFVVVDPSVVKVELDVPEASLALVAMGAHVSVEADGLPGRTFSGALEYVAPSVDASTRTVKARLTLANEDGALRTGMLVHAHVATTASTHAAAVPSEAVHDIEGVAIVFVRLEPDKFEARRVVASQREGDLVPIVSGVAPGEIVATTGSFLLETELLKSSIGAGCCEVD